jgi:hypothetical protein
MNSIKCNLCNQNFNNFEKKPLILPKCGHTFCKTCLEARLKSKERYLCPEDEIEYKKIKEVSNLPTNNIILRLIEDSIVKEKPQLCTKHNKVFEYYCLSDNVT